MGVKWRTLLRRRVYEPDQLDIGNLKRCLSVWDLTALGLGSSLGVGVYVLVGIAALNLAGPAIVLSFIIAAVASMFAAMCYAELGSRVPKAGSAYTYTYVTMGELVAFIVGWNMILEAVFGTASIARGLSMYVDSMSNNTMSSWLESVVPIYSANLSPYFDFFSFFVVIILGVLLAIGVRESSYVNNMLTIVNIIVIAFIICAGAFKAELSNWSTPPAEVPEGRGVGGFFPYGVWGVLRGAAVCFYGFVGFDSIGSTGEEVRDPQRAIPTSIMLTQGIAFISYAGVATVLTMMMPYYLQETVASAASAFSYAGWDWAWFVVTAGAVIGITASLYGSMFPLPRLLYSMSSDGLMFHCLSRVTANRKTPTIATLVPTAVIALLAAILELNELILMMCVGTLLAYTVVASCVILLRYRSSASSLGWTAKQIFGLGHRFPTKMTSNTINILLLLFMCTCVLCALVTSLWWSLAALVSLHVVAVLLLLVMTVQPQNNEDLAFKTPLVPIIPCLSIYVNIHLMILIKPQTWIRVLIWIAIGIPVYIFCVCYYKQPVDDTLDNDIDFTHAKANGKAPVQIYVVSPTPPDTIGRSNQGGEYENEDEIQVDIQQNIVRIKQPIITEEVIVQHALVAENEEKEAKIIDLLDRVLQAEEESYADMKEQKEEVVNEPQAQETTTHRKSLSELSDTGSDASMGTQGLSKYDVIAQVHREDLPKLTEEEEEKSDKETDTSDNENGEQEEVTAFNDSDANSRTDESGYSDTLDKTVLGESTEDLKEEISIIPVPPPLDENFFASPAFKKSYTISVRPPKRQIEQEEKIKPRESVESNNSNDDTPMVFGSDKQMHFMSKLENIFQNKMANDNDGDTHLKRSNSTGNVAESANSDPVRERPAIFLDLKKEIISREAAQNLRRVDADENKAPRSIHSSIHPSDDEEEKDSSLSREDLKSKLEHIYAVGGPRLSKSRLIKSNSPTPEEASQTDISSVESVPKTPKKEKNDTLKRQKARYGEVLNSLRMMNTDDQV